MDIKDQMLKYFQRPQINELILEYVHEHNIDPNSITNQQLTNILDDLNLLDQLEKAMEHPPHNEQLEIDKENFEIDLLTRLYFTIEKGYKLRELSKYPPHSRFYISVSGFGHKQRTVQQAVCESFGPQPQHTLKINPAELKLENNSPIELSLVVVLNNGNKVLYSVKMVEWRYLLCYGTTCFDIELAPYQHDGTTHMQSVGIISVRMKLSPISKYQMISENAVHRQLELEKRLKQDNNSKFYSYATDFWKEYKAVHCSFQDRRVKIYGDSEDKIYIPLCKMVNPLYNVRGVDSPQHALRFVSLIPFEEPRMNGNVYKRFNSMINSNQGSIDDHNNLLCSLLLGFGLNAFVCLGLNVKGENHSWVMSQNKKSITFWQVTKGTKFDYYSPQTFKNYRSICVVYNHSKYYANIQLDNSISTCKFTFSNNTEWKQFSQQFLKGLQNYNKATAFYYPNLNTNSIQASIENELYKLLKSFRKNNKLTLNCDHILQSILSIAIANYQIQRITGNIFCQDQFQQAIRNYIPLKHTFKAFPIQLTSLNPEQIFSQLKNYPKCHEIMLVRGDSIHFAIKSKLIVFPDNVFALWISLAVRYYKA